MTTIILTILAGLAPAVGLFVGWWIKNAPARREKKRREINAQIHDEVARHDENAVRERLRRTRAEN